VLRDRDDVRALLAEVDAALARFEDGSFGVCDRCHDPIETERLVTDPLTRVCLGCLTDEQARTLERDLELASAIQVRLLPPPSVRANGWEVGYRYRPAGPVSGDYCDVLLTDEPSGPVHFVLGDVSGKGVAASILMANHSYATIVIGRLQPTGALEVVNAGHPAPLLVRDGDVLELAATGLPLGLFRDARFETRRFDLSAGNLLFLYSDGVSEAHNSAKQPYGSRRLGSVVAAAGAAAVDDVLRSCLDDLAAFCNGGSQVDDVTLLAVRRAER
jgi:sigma-B regulation protein RsbU (phosphoserine phosphatase)